MGKTITIDGVEITPREEVTLRGMRQLAELEEDTGLDFSSGNIAPGDVMKLMRTENGPRRLMQVLCKGDLEKVDFDEMPGSVFQKMLQDFFGGAGGKTS